MWRYSKPDWMWCWAKCCSQHCLRSEVGLGDCKGFPSNLNHSLTLFVYLSCPGIHMYCSCVQLSTLPKAGSVDPSEALTLIVILSYVCVLKEWISLLLFDTGLAETGVPFMCLLHHYNLHFCTIQPISIFCNISKTRSVAPYSHQFINNFLIVLKGVEKSLYLDSQKRFECTAICWKYRVSYRLVRTVHAVRHTRLV